MEQDSLACHICGERKLYFFDQFKSFYRVTSDSKTFTKGGSLCICKKCGIVQKPVDRKWKNEVKGIYENYSLYFHSNTCDQLIFNQTTGTYQQRVEIIIDNFKKSFHTMPNSGMLLDVGCGRGAFLRAFNQRYPNWSMYGCDLNEINRTEVEAIPGVKAYITKDLAEIDGRYDIISLSHVLEHVPSPTILLKMIHTKLNPEGLLIIQVPDVSINSFDILVADHCSHFTLETLKQLVLSVDFEVCIMSSNWLPKELTIVAKRKNQSDPITTNEQELPVIEATTQMIEVNINWLQLMKNSAEKISKKEGFGIFGTAISAIWLDSELHNAATFFCDEDPGRVGKTLLNRPILHPKDIQDFSNVFVPLVPEIAKKVINRLSRDQIYFQTVNENQIVE